MERPNLSSFQAVRLNNTDELFCLDLVPPILKEEISGEDYRYFMTWSLIAACSIKVKHRNAPFKPEYIIPQLLLEWVTQEPTVHGIRYNSIQTTHQQNSVLEGDFSNLVIPVKENAKSGYCTQLIKLFRISEPVSWEMEQVNSGGMTFISSEKENEIYNRKIPYLELVKGKKTPYAYTALADIEKSLSSMKLDFII